MGPLAHSVLYPRCRSREAIPKYISGRTSYFQVCLAFHPYPQLIRAFFNIQRFGPPRDFTRASTWPWIDHLVSGLLRTTQRPIQTRFRCGSGPEALSLAVQSKSPAHYAKGTRSHRLQATMVLPLLVSRRFQVLFHSPHRGTFHLSLTVLVHYRLPRSI